MSYSFLAVAASKALALAAVAAELDKVADAQPVHGHDRAQAEAATEALIALAREPGENEEIRVSVAGSLGWAQGVDPAPGRDITHASLSINVAVLAKT